MKRWAAWPRGLRWLTGGIAAVVLALVVAWILFVPAADWLAHHDVGSVKGPLLQTARDAARGRLLTLGAGLFAAGALFYTARNLTLYRRQLLSTEQAQQKTLELTEQGQVTDRYTKAIEQLGSDKLDVRIGGIYALERIARDSARDHPTVMEVLSAFIREHSREVQPPDSGGEESQPLSGADIEAALIAIGRRNIEQDVQPISLNDSRLDDVQLRGANLTRVILSIASLRRAKLIDGNLTNADLVEAKLTHAMLLRANLTGAVLVGADLDHAFLYQANLTGADLTAAYLTFANLQQAQLSAAHLFGADLTGANLTGADLTGAELADADLTDADLTNVLWPEERDVPEGWQRGVPSGRLKRSYLKQKHVNPDEDDSESD